MIIHQPQQIDMTSSSGTRVSRNSYFIINQSIFPDVFTAFRAAFRKRLSGRKSSLIVDPDEVGLERGNTICMQSMVVGTTDQLASAIEILQTDATGTNFPVVKRDTSLFWDRMLAYELDIAVVLFA